MNFFGIVDEVLLFNSLKLQDKDIGTLQYQSWISKEESMTQSFVPKAPSFDFVAHCDSDKTSC